METLFLVLSCSLCLTACHRTLTPTSAQALWVAVGAFENNTSEPILDVTATALLRETLHQRHLPITPHPDEAAFVLTGTLNSMRQTLMSLNQEGAGRAYRATLGITYRLVSKNNNPIEWQGTAHADWIAQPSNLSGEFSERHRALRKALRELSEKAVNRLMEIMESPPRGLEPGGASRQGSLDP